MLHPSYSDLMNVVNSEVEQGEAPVVNSRYSIVMATSKRAREIIDGDEPMVKADGIKVVIISKFTPLGIERGGNEEEISPNDLL